MGLMWLAGATRYVNDNSHIGFHAAYDGHDGSVSSAGNAWVGAYLNKLGFGLRTIEFLTSMPPDDMRYLKPWEMYQLDAKHISNWSAKPLSFCKKYFPLAMCAN